MEPITTLEINGHRIIAIYTPSGTKHQFEMLYSALGVNVRSELATVLRAEHDESGTLIVDEDNRTSVPGLYATGDIVQGLSQIMAGFSGLLAGHIELWNRPFRALRRSRQLRHFPGSRRKAELTTGLCDRLHELAGAGYRSDRRGFVTIMLAYGCGAGKCLQRERLVQTWPSRGNVWCGDSE